MTDISHVPERHVGLYHRYGREQGIMEVCGMRYGSEKSGPWRIYNVIFFSVQAIPKLSIAH